MKRKFSADTLLLCGVLIILCCFLSFKLEPFYSVSPTVGGQIQSFIMVKPVEIFGLMLGSVLIFKAIR